MQILHFDIFTFVSYIVVTFILNNIEFAMFSEINTFTAFTRCSTPRDKVHFARQKTRNIL